MPKHIVRLLLLVVFALFAFVGVRSVMVDNSFAMFGHYRGASVQEIAFPAPVMKTPAYCQLCHVDRHAEWRAAGHRTVMCETCHGPAIEHPAKGKLPIPEYSVSLCIACHEHMPARRRDFPQVVLLEHLAGQDKPQQCIACHDPHTLKIMDPSAQQASGEATTPETEATAKKTSAGGAEPAALAPAVDKPGPDAPGVATGNTEDDK